MASYFAACCRRVKPMTNHARNGKRITSRLSPEGAFPDIEDPPVVGEKGKPKAVAVSHQVEFVSSRLYADAWALCPSDTVVVAISLGWIYGLNPGSLPALRSGATIALMDRFNPVRVLGEIQTRRATVFMGVPTMYAMMVEHVAATGKRYDVSSLRLPLCAGAELAPSVAARFERIFGIRIRNFLGISEVKLVASPRESSRECVPEGSVGRPPDEVQVCLVDDQGRNVPVEQAGEVLIKTPALMSGYYKDPATTASVMRDGWYVSGDLTKFDENGFLYVVGRVRDQIIRGGAKIAPAEVEEVLIQHPGVSMAAVIGAPDAVYGELVKAVIVRRDEKVAASDLEEFCRSRLAAYKVPTAFEFRLSLPLGPTGKVLKKALR
jgi:long-chain acyl-CoA synthetase